MEVLDMIQLGPHRSQTQTAPHLNHSTFLNGIDTERISNNSTTYDVHDGNGSTQSVVWTSDIVFRVSAISTIMFLTLLGNISLLALTACYRRLRRRRVNIFLMNLAIADVMVCVVTMTSEIVFVAFGEWILGNVGCKLVIYGQIVTLASTTFLLTAMSIDRYQVSQSADSDEHLHVPSESTY